MKSLINKIFIGAIFVFGVALIPIDTVRADTFTYLNYTIEASLDKNITAGENYVLGADPMYITIDAYDSLGNPYYGAYGQVSVGIPLANNSVTSVWSGTLLPVSGNWNTVQIPSYILPTTTGGYEVGIILEVTPASGNTQSSGMMMGLPFMVGNSNTVNPPVVTPPTPKTVTIDAYRTTNLSTVITKNASNVTTDPIQPGESIRLYWEAKNFNSNVVCTLPPNGTKTTAGTPSGYIPLLTGPSETTKYEITCNDEVTAPTAPATTNLHINTGFTGGFVTTSPSNPGAPSGQGGKLIVRINSTVVCNTSDPSYPAGVGGQGYNVSDCGSGNYTIKAGDVISVSASGYQNYHNVASYKVGSMQFQKNTQDLLNFTSSSATSKDYTYTITDVSANYSVGATFIP